MIVKRGVLFITFICCVFGGKLHKKEKHVFVNPKNDSGFEDSVQDCCPNASNSCTQKIMHAASTNIQPVDILTKNPSERTILQTTNSEQKQLPEPAQSKDVPNLKHFEQKNIIQPKFLASESVSLKTLTRPSTISNKSVYLVSKSDIKEWGLKLYQNKRYLIRYFESIDVPLSKSYSIRYFDESVSANVFILSNQKKSFIFKILTECEYYAEINVVPIISSMGSPYFPKFHCVSPSSSKLPGTFPIEIMEHCPGNDMFVACSEKSFKNFDLRAIFAQMIYALHLLNDSFIVHRDIKLENFLLDSEGHVRLIDFGFATQMTSYNQTLRDILGTKYYIAPEVLKGKYTFRCDWFSLGISFWMIITDENISIESFDNVPNLLEIIVAHPAHDLIRLLLEPECSRLCTLVQVKKHPFFKDFDWSLIESGYQ